MYFYKIVSEFTLLNKDVNRHNGVDRDEMLQHAACHHRGGGGFRISGKGVHMFKGEGGVRFADFILLFLNIP